MALAFGAWVRNGNYTKVFTATALDNDAAANLVVAFTPNLGAVPIDASIIQTASAAGNVPADWAITAMAATGCTIRKLTAPGAGNAHTIQVTVRTVHSIDR